MITIVVAASLNNVIGDKNRLIWRQSSDLKRFKQITLNKTVIMGRKTFESIGRPLPNRRNIIISRQKNEIDGCEIVSSIEEALTKDSDIYILGGGEIYEKTIHLADKILLTLIHSEFEGDTFFPEIDSSWKKISEEHFKSDSMNEYDYSFIEYSKI